MVTSWYLSINHIWQHGQKLIAFRNHIWPHGHQLIPVRNHIWPHGHQLMPVQEPHLTTWSPADTGPGTASDHMVTSWYRLRNRNWPHGHQLIPVQEIDTYSCLPFFVWRTSLTDKITSVASEYMVVYVSRWASNDRSDKNLGRNNLINY